MICKGEGEEEVKDNSQASDLALEQNRRKSFGEK